MGKAYDVVRTFEEEVASWAGAKYGVAVESCCAAIFLSLKYIGHHCFFFDIPKFTYPGVAMAIKNSGNIVNFKDKEWKGIYEIKAKPTLGDKEPPDIITIKGPFPYMMDKRLPNPTIIDSALRFKKDMYVPKTLYCLSFHYKKHLPIGRGGMILTDDEKAVEWLKMARFDGRKEIPLEQDNATICGWNMYMTPEQAARGLTLFEAIKDKDLPDLKVSDQNYPNLSTWRCFR